MVPDLLMSWLTGARALAGLTRLHRVVLCIYSQFVWSMGALPFEKESRKALGMLHWNLFEGMKGHMGRDLIVLLGTGQAW